MSSPHDPLTPYPTSPCGTGEGAPPLVSFLIPPLVRRHPTLVGLAAPAVPDAADALPDGALLGDYAIDRLRGQDDTCDTYLVTRRADGTAHAARVVRRAALVARPELRDTLPVALPRLLRLRHPNLVAVLAHGLTDEPEPRPYLIHERLVGRDLAVYQDRHGTLEWPLVAAIGLQCAAALDLLHRHGLAHTHLRRGSVVFVPVAGDHFQIKLGGLEHARAIDPGDPAVRADLRDLGILLRELAATPLPGAFADLLARMVDDTEQSAAPIEAALRALCDAIDPDSAAAMMNPTPEPPPPFVPVPRRPSFGEQSLVMSRERPQVPSGLAGGPLPWLLWVLSAALVVLLGAESLTRPHELRRLPRDHEPDSVQLELTALPAASTPAAAPPRAHIVASPPCKPATPRAPRARHLPRPVLDALPRLEPPAPAQPIEPPPAEPTVVALPSEPDELGLMPVPVRPSSLPEQS